MSAAENRSSASLAKGNEGLEQSSVLNMRNILTLLVVVLGSYIYLRRRRQRKVSEMLYL
jgi:hypothetical protein